MSTSLTRTQSLSLVFIMASFASAIVLVVNALKRAGFIALTPATQLAAPLAQLLAIGLVVGIFAATPAIRGRLGSIGAVLYSASLVLLVGVEFVINLVFPYVTPEVIGDLRAGPLGIAFTVASVSFLLGTLVFFTRLLAGRRVSEVRHRTERCQLSADRSPNRFPRGGAPDRPRRPGRRSDGAGLLADPVAPGSACIPPRARAGAPVGEQTRRFSSDQQGMRPDTTTVARSAVEQVPGADPVVLGRVRGRTEVNQTHRRVRPDDVQGVGTER